MLLETLRRRFLRKIEGMSAREAALHTSIAFSTIARMRRLENKYYVSPRVIKAMQCYVDDKPYTPDQHPVTDRLTALEQRVAALEDRLDGKGD